MKLVILITLFFSSLAFSECVHEVELKGEEIKSISNFKNRVFFLTPDDKYIRADKFNIIDKKQYSVQIIDQPKDHDNKTIQNYLEYYSYSHLEKFINHNTQVLSSKNYQTSIVGLSIKKRNLYKIAPIKIDPNKKLILMFGRHHGDEGSANWIIEGFVKEFLSNESLNSKFQFVLYPMINPDGAEARIRYNANGRDLNRTWHKDPSLSLDESRIINLDLQNYLGLKKQIPLVLDMHGSFREDFIYRVKKSFNGEEFFLKQQDFIDTLGAIDLWQNSNYKFSNGHPRMARIILSGEYGLNTLTHETIKNIPLSNRVYRSVGTLMDQGLAIAQTIITIY